MLELIEDIQPDFVICNGDLLDCSSISRWDKNPMQLISLQSEIDAGKQLLSDINTIAKKSDKIILEGNHEARLSKLVAKLDPAAAQLACLNVFQANITWPVLLELQSTGWEWVSEADQTHSPLLPNLLIKHGTIVRKESGASAKGEFERYGISGVSGHTHRLAQVFFTKMSKTYVWSECGCLCSLNPVYSQDVNWQQGIVICHWENRNAYPTVELIHIQHGRATYRGHSYGSK